LGSILGREHKNLSVVRLEGRVVSLNSEEARKVGDHKGNLTIVKLKRRITRLGELVSAFDFVITLFLE